MALKVNTTFAGIAANDTRPNVQTRQLQQLATLAADQAYLWEKITEFKIPPASGGHSISNVGHNHIGGSAGQPIPRPLASKACNIQLINNAGSTGGDYAPFDRALIRTPPGVATIKAIVYASSASFVMAANVFLYSESGGALTLADVKSQWESEGQVGDGVYAYSVKFSSLTTDAFYSLSFQYFEGEYNGGFRIPECTVYGWTIIPWLGPPREVPAYTPPSSLGSTAVRVPPADQHLDGTGDDCPFTSFDETLFADYRSVNSYLIASMAANDALLYELASGRPATGLGESHTSTTRWDGHNHGGEADDASPLYTNETLGNTIDITLAGQTYGSLRSSPNYGNLYSTADEATTSASTWEGQCSAPVLQVSAGSTARVVCRVPVRLPRVITAYLNASTRLRFAALIYHDPSKVSGTGQSHLDVKMWNSALTLAGSPNTASSDAVTPAHFEVVTCNVDAQTSGDGEVLELLEIAMRYDGAPSGIAFALLSWVLWFEAA